MEWRSDGWNNTPVLQHSFIPILLSFFEPAHVILPPAHRKALILVVNLQFFGTQVFRLAVQKRKMVPLAEHGEAGSALDDLLDAFSDDSVTVGTHQNRRSFAERCCQFGTAFDGAHQTHTLINRRTVSGEKFSVVVHGFELDRQNAKDRAPFRVSMGDADDFRPRFKNTG